MGYGNEDEDLSQAITLGFIFLIIIIYQKFHYIEMFFYGIKIRFLMRVHQILEFFNRPSVKLILILIVAVVFFLVIWKVLLWVEKKINQYKKRKTKKSRKNFKKPNPLFPEVHRKPGMFQGIFRKNGKADESFFQSRGFEENDDGEEEEGMDIVEDIPCPSQEIPKIIENKAKEVMKNQRDQIKKKVKKSSFSEDTDILGLR